MSAIAGVLEQRLGSLSLPLAVVLPGGRRIGRKDAAVTLRLNDLSPLAHLVTGEVGKVGQDYVEGKVDLDGGMRELMAAAAELMPGDPTAADGAAPAPLGWVRQRRADGALAPAPPARDRRRAGPVPLRRLGRLLRALARPAAGLLVRLLPRPGDVDRRRRRRPSSSTSARKLMLKEGDRFLDIGAGWGGLLLCAAENYGVRAHGITLSKNQHAHVNKADRRARPAPAGCAMDLLDYRQPADESEPYDKIASVGMFEHVGRAQPARATSPRSTACSSPAACC